MNCHRDQRSHGTVSKACGVIREGQYLCTVPDDPSNKSWSMTWVRSTSPVLSRRRSAPLNDARIPGMASERLIHITQKDIRLSGRYTPPRLSVDSLLVDLELRARTPPETILANSRLLIVPFQTIYNVKLNA